MRDWFGDFMYMSEILPRFSNKFKKPNDNTLSKKMDNDMSLGAIISGNFFIGTGRRIGGKYIVTYLHVVKKITNPGGLASIADIDRSKLDDPTVYVTFASSLKRRQRPKFHIKPDVIYINAQFEFAILELKSFECLPRGHKDRVSEIRPENANKFKKSHDSTLSEQMVNNMSVKMKSVGAIISNDSVRGTVFRVGSKYVMTALHVVKSVTNPRGLPSIADTDWSKLDHPTVYIKFAASVMDDQSPKFYIKPDVIYMNKQLDIAILELKSLECLPRSLKLSKYMGHVKCVNIIGFGHPIDPRKRLDPNCEVLNINHIITAIENFFNANPSVLQLNGLKPGGIKGEYNELGNTFMFPCHTFFEQGSSGAPAIEENDVVGILVKGMPFSYYEMRDSPYFTASGIDKLPNNLKFELCIKTESIFNDMRYVVPMLADDLFD
ncbi:uncharacterized protein LOC132715965 [Ruditapes philippinarum]|uniref:uncharacterized protein LOC132715965 n=1 Tax=Ruditapes philippinarum TaxID=129788 RepID=UPI00295C0689|nr:uncharacterized protein LOC132715965 [Ruditapes philippinarum]